VQVVRDVVYAQAPADDGTIIDLKMDTAFPKQSDGELLPTVVYIHGGGWEGGSKEGGARHMLALAVGGYFAVSIDYRLSGQAKYPAAVHDCKAAIRFLRANAERLGIDPNRIGVWGHSAGGHLASLLGTSGNSDVLEGKVGTVGPSSAVQCVINLSGPVDLNFDVPTGVIEKWLGGPPAERPQVTREASPLTYVDASDPAVLIVHGTKDEIVGLRQPEMFQKALKEAGVTVDYMPLEGVGHNVDRPEVLIRAVEFFDAHLDGHGTQPIKDLLARLAALRSGAAPASQPSTQPVPH
jgi:acetyl esterase/lipase